jgi:MFS family permease
MPAPSDERAMGLRATRISTIALIGDFFFFSVGFAFYDPMVVVPAFVNDFTGSTLLVGLLSALRVLFITLPQIWAASVLEARPRMKPLLIGSSVMGRLPVLVLAAAVFFWAGSGTQTWLVMLILSLSVILFFTSEGLNSVSWTALVGKVVPEAFRGRFFGLGQFLSSLGSLAAGYLVNRVLAQRAMALSTRWSVVFAFGFVSMMLSVVSMIFIREAPADATVEERTDVRKSLSKMSQYLHEDRWLRRMILVQLVLVTGMATFAFFVVRARQLLPNAEAMVGTFLIMQSAGSGAAALVGGLLVDHVGSWAAIRAAAFAQVLAPVAAVLAGFGVAPLVFYLLVFFLIGFVHGASWWSFSAYLLAMAPEDRRPIYLATSGVLSSITVLSPLVVGALMTMVLPEAVFAGSALLAIVGLTLAWTLRRGLRPR